MEGVTALQDSEFTIGTDRIVTGTYLFGGVLTRGRILLSGAEAGSLGEVLHVIRKTGAVVKTAPEEIFLDAGEAFLPVGKVTTRPYPGFPTDLQSALLSAMTVAQGRSEIEERIFEARFQTADQLRRMGADLEIKGEPCQDPGRFFPSWRLCPGKRAPGRSCPGPGCSWSRRDYTDPG